jgi:formylglycine-generating enzyme required for sulfatase activity
MSRALALLPFALALLGQTPRVTPPAPDRTTIPAGPFWMGQDTLGELDERPRHQVTLGAYAIDRTEVTRGNYLRCVRAGVCTSPWELGPRFEGLTQPIVGVSWHQARQYCTWTGGRLPTEAEWEKAARGSDGRTYPWGETYPTNGLAVFGRAERTGRPDPVGSHPRGASPYGLLDMAGNVWEWTESPYDPFAYRHPETPATCETALASLDEIRRSHVRGFTGSNPLPNVCERVLRGGGWNYGGPGLRSSNRVHHAPNFRLMMSGFRCAADAQPATTDAAH